MTHKIFETNATTKAQVMDAEALSALMDNEASGLEVRRLMGRISDQPELLATWKRYQLVNSALQQSLHIRPNVDLSVGIEAVLADEPVPLHSSISASSLKTGGFWKLAGQVAIAASVAVMAVVGVSSFQGTVIDQGNPAIQSAGLATTPDAGLPVLAGEYQPSALERTVRLDPAARTRLQQAVYQFSTSRDVQPELILELPSEPFADAELPVFTSEPAQ